MSHKNLVILAGGASSRMKKQIQVKSSLSTKELEQANTRSKGLISIDDSGRPLLDYVLYNAKKAGYTTVFIITGKDNALFKSYYGEKDSDNRYKGLTIHFAIQHIPNHRVKPFGTADALLQAIEQYTNLKQESFTVCNSDNLYSVEAFELLRTCDNKNALISYDREGLLFSSERISRFALMQFDSENYYLKGIVEKPAAAALDQFRDSNGKLRVSMNIFKFSGQQFYPYVKNCPVHPERDEKELPTALMNMIADDGESTLGIPMYAHVPDLTSKEDIAILKEYVSKIDLSNW